jgi:hypothetical protein
LAVVVDHLGDFKGILIAIPVSLLAISSSSSKMGVMIEVDLLALMEAESPIWHHRRRSSN